MKVTFNFTSSPGMQRMRRTVNNGWISKSALVTLLSVVLLFPCVHVHALVYDPADLAVLDHAGHTHAGHTHAGSDHGHPHAGHGGHGGHADNDHLHPHPHDSALARGHEPGTTPRRAAAPVLAQAKHRTENRDHDVHRLPGRFEGSLEVLTGTVLQAGGRRPGAEHLHFHFWENLPLESKPEPLSEPTGFSVNTTPPVAEPTVQQPLATYSRRILLQDARLVFISLTTDLPPPLG